jgi:hypothetical protein
MNLLTIDLCACVHYVRACTRELGELDAIFLAEKLLVVSPIADLVNLDRLVTFGCHEKLARVIEIEAEDMAKRSAVLTVVALEELFLVRTRCFALLLASRGILYLVRSEAGDNFRDW